MKNPIQWLRLSYWIGAILDAKAALIVILPKLVPQLYSAITGQPVLDVASSGIFFRPFDALMVFAWTCLLLWADRKPLERKGVLLLTIVPVLSGILTLRISRGLYNANLSGVFTLLLIAYTLLCIFSYFINSSNK
ncbi:MAG TPA: hypothetical protein DDW65_09345 [Firmicutes bacterium]|jgi:hypothetical protein|nr:hypothetical protein [Bacillota bacterium]